jgi:hypothetical protein
MVVMNLRFSASAVSNGHVPFWSTCTQRWYIVSHECSTSGSRALMASLSKSNSLSRSSAIGTASRSRRAREVPTGKDEHHIPQMCTQFKRTCSAVLAPVVVSHVMIQPVGAHAGSHFANAKRDASDESPHTFDGLATRSTSSVREVERVRRLAAPCVSHQMHFGNEMSEPFARYVEVLEFVGERLEAGPEVLHELTVDVVRVKNRDLDVERFESRKKAEHHVAVTVASSAFVAGKHIKNTNRSPFWRFTAL